MKKLLFLALITPILASCSPSDTPSARGLSCQVVVDEAEGRSEIELVLYGDGDTSADLFHEDGNLPIRALGMYSKEFVDTHEPYIHKVYSSFETEAGSYRIEYRGPAGNGERTVELDDNRSLLIHIDCR